MYCVTDVNLQMHKNRKFAKFFQLTSFSRYEVRNFLENFVFSILNRVVLMEFCELSLETSYEFVFPSTIL